MLDHIKKLVLTVVLFATSIPGQAEEKTNPLDKAPSQFAKFGDIKVHYKSLGEGDTALVFVHGWTCNLNFWQFQVPAFDGKIRMILVDLPGHGQSDKPKVEYTPDYFAKSVEAVLKDAGVEKAVLAGHSMGTPVIRRFSQLFPNKTAGLIVVDGGLRLPPIKQGDLDKFISPYTVPEWKQNVAKFVDSMFTEQTPADVRKHVREGMPSAPQHVAVSAMRETFNPANWKDGPIEVPLQLILAKSPFWNADYEQYVRKIAPQVDYRVMEGVGHFLMMEKPKEFNEIMSGFLKKEGFLKP
jgi:pimeloyl-ACP methyl ester carboxylesterase